MGEPARQRHWRVKVDTRSARHARHQEELRDAYRATALSTIVPAAGLFRTNWRLAALIALVFVPPLGYLAWSFLRHGALSSLLDIGVDRRKLLVVIAVILLLALAWIVGIVATSRDRRPRDLERSEDRRLTAFTAAMCAFVLAPTALAVNGVSIQRATVGDVLSVSSREETTDEGADPWADIPRVNVLLLGSDHDPDREGVRPDSIMVVSIDTATGDSVLIGLPRNLERVPFPLSNPLHQVYPEGYDCGDACLLNGVWTLGEDRPDLFPGDPSPGLTATRDVVSQITGLTIDDTVVINLAGFEQLVDAMGGVTINAIERVPIGGKVVDGQVVGIRGWIEPGVQHMDGYHALWYSRSRATTDDYSRMRRQRCVVGALVDQVDPVRMLARYPQLAKAAADNITVDIPADDLDAWAELVLRMKDGRLQSLPITNEVVDVGHPDFALIRSLVREAITAPTSAPTSATPSGTPTGPGTSTSTDAPTEGPTGPDDTLSDVGATC